MMNLVEIECCSSDVSDQTGKYGEYSLWLDTYRLLNAVYLTLHGLPLSILNQQPPTLRSFPVS